jgi:hypothetical protein
MIQEYISNVKANIAMTSITILSSLIIAKIILFLFIKTRKKSLDYSKIKLNYFLNLIKKTEKNNANNIIFLPFYNKMLKLLKEDEDLLENNEDDFVSKFNKTKKIIKKLTKDFLKQKEKINNNKFESQRDKIFYVLLNNLHFMNKNNDKHKLMNDNISNKYQEAENS